MGAREATIVDAAQTWLDRQSKEHPALARALEGKRGKEIHQKAQLLTQSWQRAWLQRVKLLRKEEAFTFRITKDQSTLPRARFESIVRPRLTPCPQLRGQARRLRRLCRRGTT
jgi:hypothetical protein